LTVDLSMCEKDELEQRASTLLDELDLKLKEVGPILEKIGRLRKELDVIGQELLGREEGA